MMPSLLILQVAAPLSSDVVSTVDHFTNFLLKYAVALAAVGALAMVIVEAVKKLLDSRTRFQCLRWIQWLTMPEVFPAAQFTTKAGDTSARTAALADLLALCTGISQDEAEKAANSLIAKEGNLPWNHGFGTPSPAHALFALELERMMGSIQEAADIALTSPSRYSALYLAITSGANRTDVEQWYKEAETGMAELGNTEPSPGQRQKIKDLAEQLARLRQFTKRKLDGFQLYTGDSWATHNQVWANIAGIVVMAGVVWSLRDAHKLGYLAMAGLSILGGVLSPLAKDLVNALKRVKDG